MKRLATALLAILFIGSALLADAAAEGAAAVAPQAGPPAPGSGR